MHAARMSIEMERVVTRYLENVNLVAFFNMVRHFCYLKVRFSASNHNFVDYLLGTTIRVTLYSITIYNSFFFFCSDSRQESNNRTTSTGGQRKRNDSDSIIIAKEVKDKRELTCVVSFSNGWMW